MDNQDLKYIKKHYNENFAKLCRELFPTLLETPGLLSKIITEKFDATPTIYEDILPIKNEFKNYVYSFFNVEKQEAISTKTPEELLDEAGYVLFPECKTEKDIQKFKKYYKSGEELCTFRGQRLDSCRVWFAVKKNVDEIKREDFTNPQRQDEYGTSVISIQFTKGENSTVSIKNRYNHSVNNPDATFSNSLNNIINGLEDAFCEKYGISLDNNFCTNFNADDYIIGNDGKIYKSILNFNHMYYCSNNYVIDSNNNVTYYDKSKYVLIENYLLDLQNKSIINLFKNKHDSFTRSIGEIKSVSITVDENKNRIIDITPLIGENVKIVTNQSNQILKYFNSNVKKIGNSFLSFNKTLTEIDLPNLKTIGDDFLYLNENVEKVNLPNVKKIGVYFLKWSGKLAKINLPNVEEIGKGFLTYNEKLSEINLPNVKEIGDSCLYSNTNLTEIDLPNVETIGDDFLYFNERIKKINFPNIKEIGDGFLTNNKKLTKIDLPDIEKIGDNFLK